MESKGRGTGLLQLQLAEKKLYLHPSQKGPSGFLFTITGRGIATDRIHRHTASVNIPQII